jgi:cytidylate kinase
MTPLPDVALPPSEERLLEVTRRVVDEAVVQGPVVLVGRGAQSMLAERADAVHIFCYAPRPALVARIMRRERLSQADAEHLVDDTNKQREAFVKRHWGRRWLAHENYHACVNTEWLGVDGAADLVTSIVARTLGTVAPR